MGDTTLFCVFKYFINKIMKSEFKLSISTSHKMICLKKNCIPTNEVERKLSHYNKLKLRITDQTKKFGIFAATYSSIAISPKSSILTLFGLVGSLIYLQMIYRDIESVHATGPTPALKAIESNFSIEKLFKTLLLAYSFGLRPRLLVPTFLAFICWIFNQSIEYPNLQIGIIDETSMLVGFL